jgi:ribulose-5-phosphate 4-epimerase/fuculose-1-phosphate aldolase
VHRGREDVGCVIHTHSIAGMAISALDCGLLPITQTAMYFDGVGMHEYESVAIDLAEQKRLVRDLADKKAMILRNHGLLAVGPTVAEAFTNLFWLERACKAQVAAMSCNTKLHLPAQDVIEKTNSLYRPETRRRWGPLEWPALLRLVDRKYPGFRD